MIGGGDTAADINATSNIVSITTNNSINSASGTFVIELIYKTDQSGEPLYYKAVEPLDLVDIWLSKSGTTMMGIIDQVNKMTSLSERGPQRRVRITGRSLGAIWEFDLIKYFPGAGVELPDELADRNFQLQAGTIRYDFWGKSVADVIVTLYEKLPALEIHLKDATLKDFVNVGDELLTRSQEKLYNIKPSPYQGSLFDYFVTYTGRPFNEIWTDSKKGKLYLRLRPTPFNMPMDGESVHLPSGGNVSDYSWNSRESSTWITDEPYHEIDRSMIQEENLARSQARAYSIFGVVSSDRLLDTKELEYATFPLIVEPELYRELGSRDHILRIDFIPVTQGHEKGEGFFERFKFYRKALYLFEKDNHRWEEGTISIRGNADIRVGDKIKRTDNKKSYYVTSIMNRWQYGRPMVSTLTLSRGATDKERNNFYQVGLDYIESAGLA